MRRLLLRAILLAGLVAAIIWLSREHVPALTDDFIAYWSAARLLARGGDPYDPASLLAVQQSVGWPHATPLPVWYGPWIVALSAPIGLLPYWPGRVGWMIAQIVLLLGAASITWRVYDGSAESRRPFLLATTFAPAILCLVEGQITPLILFGLACFLRCSQRREDWLAGLALLPLTAKPAVLYLVWPALLLWTLRSGRVRILGGLAVTAIAASVAALVLNPDVFGEWLRFGAATSPLGQNYTPTVGSVLRSVFGTDRVWLAYVSVGVGLLWWVSTWRRYHQGLDWRDELPTLTFASLVTAPFAWSHDALLVFPAVLQAAVRSQVSAVGNVWLLLNGASVALYPVLRYRQTWYLLYLMALAAWHRYRQSGSRDISDR
jgi:Glycosyltransferase family 87